MQHYCRVNSLRSFRRGLVAEHQIINSRARRNVRLHGTPGDVAAVVKRTGRVSLLPNRKRGFGQNVGLNAVVVIRSRVLVARRTHTAGTGTLSGGLELANRGYIRRPFGQRKFVIAEGAWSNRKSRVDDDPILLNPEQLPHLLRDQAVAV